MKYHGRRSWALMLTALAWLVACKQDKNAFTLQGKVDELEEESLYLYHVNDLRERVDTIKIKKGKFLLKSTIEEPGLAYLSLPGKEDQAVEIFLEPGKFIISGNAYDPANWKVEGGSLQKMHDAFRETIMPVVKEYNQLVAEKEMIVQSGKMPEDFLDQRLDALKESYYEKIYAFLEQQPATMVSAYIINSELLFDPDFERIDKVLSRMDSTVLRSSYVKRIEANLYNARKAAPGTMAPTFTLPDLEGNQVSLDRFRGKYVLVDFWASWCGPCRQENSRLVRIYNEYKGKNFEMLGVSIDRVRQQWKDAVISDKLSWTQVINENGVAEQQYGITIIPANILIDPQGKIIARNLFGTRLENKLKEVLQPGA